MVAMWLATKPIIYWWNLFSPLGKPRLLACDLAFARFLCQACTSNLVARVVVLTNASDATSLIFLLWNIAIPFAGSLVSNDRADAVCKLGWLSFPATGGTWHNASDSTWHEWIIVSVLTVFWSGYAGGEIGPRSKLSLAGRLLMMLSVKS